MVDSSKKIALYVLCFLLALGTCVPLCSLLDHIVGIAVQFTKLAQCMIVGRPHVPTRSLKESPYHIFKRFWVGPL